VAGRFSKRHKRYIREENNKLNNRLIDKLLVQIIVSIIIVILVNRILVMAPILAPTFGVISFKGAYLPQKLTPKSSIETQTVSVQGHVLSYQVKRSKDCFVWAAPLLLIGPLLFNIALIS
jgi:hypothetical protein